MTQSVGNTHNVASSFSSAQVQQSGRKRGREEMADDDVLGSIFDVSLDPRVTGQFIKKCKTEFDAKPENAFHRNAIVNVGLEFAALNSVEADKVNHIFLNTIKEEHVKATNQAHSGRCWMFAGLNTFRHMVIKALNMKNFEFSETYLFFWDKFERSNSFLLYVLDTLDVPTDERHLETRLRHPIEDGGWWQTFSNLVDKYGVIPKDAMPEAAHSGFSSTINQVIKDKLLSTACYLRREHKKMGALEILKVKDQTMKEIYGVLVKFLGEPPKEFNWSFLDVQHQPRTIAGLTPQSFAAMTLPGIDIKDFVVLGNFTNKSYHKMYEIMDCNNVEGGVPPQFLNVPIRELKKYAMESILKGVPVWFGADVTQGASYLKSAFDEKLVNEAQIFGENYPLTKDERLRYFKSEANHAMSFIGVDVDEAGMPIKWQVENSWGYYDDEVPGEDGFWVMSDKWFDDNVFEVVVHKNFLSEKLRKELNTEPVEVPPWDPICEASKLP